MEGYNETLRSSLIFAELCRRFQIFCKFRIGFRPHLINAGCIISARLGPTFILVEITIEAAPAWFTITLVASILRTTIFVIIEENIYT